MEQMSWSRMVRLSRFACGNNQTSIVNIHCPTVLKAATGEAAVEDEMAYATRRSYEDVSALMCTRLPAFACPVSNTTWVWRQQVVMNWLPLMGAGTIVLIGMAVVWASAVWPTLKAYWYYKAVRLEREARLAKFRNNSVSDIIGAAVAGPQPSATFPSIIDFEPAGDTDEGIPAIRRRGGQPPPAYSAFQQQRPMFNEKVY